MGTLTRVLFVVSMVLIGFGAVGLLASFIYTRTGWIDSFYSASLYGNTVGIILLLVTTFRLRNDLERARSAAGAEEKEIDSHE